MPQIGSFFSNIFGGGGGSGIQPSDINVAPSANPSILGLPPGVDPSTISSGATGGGSPAWMKLLTAGMFGGGELGNLLQQHKSDQYTDLLLKYAQNPALLSQAVASATKPLDNALVQNVNNTVQGNMAQRGLSQAPGIFAASEAQALAPFVQQNQQTAQNQVLASLGLPGQATNINQRPQDLSGALSMFLRAMGQNPFAHLPGTQTPTGVPQQTPQQPGLDLSGLNFPQAYQPPSFGDTTFTGGGGQ